jgi:hypothetical protein
LRSISTKCSSKHVRKTIHIALATKPMDMESARSS